MMSDVRQEKEPQREHMQGSMHLYIYSTAQHRNIDPGRPHTKRQEVLSIVL